MKRNILMSALAISFLAISCEDKTANKQPISQETTTTTETLSKEDAEKLTKVREALADFPSANAEIVNGAVVVSGNVSPTQERKIKEAIETLNIGEYTNNLVVK